MYDKCLACNRKVSFANCKTLQCKDCKKLFHPRCVRKLPPACLKKNGNYRYKIIRNKNWKCNICTSEELPFSNVSATRVREMHAIQRRVFPTAEELNDLFVEETKENDNDFEFTYFSNKTRYVNSHEIGSFKDESSIYDDFPIISINVRSIVNKDHWTAFEAFIDSMPIKPLIIGLTETWVTDSSQGPYLNLPGYNFAQNHRHVFGGGGVGIYIAEHLHYSVIEDMTIMKEKIFESLFVNVDIYGKNVICGAIYRKSRNSAHEAFANNMEKVLKQCKKIE